ncbi:hypothetical protein BH10ACI2_BH10ACI2_15170 [soil metagenome]
MRSRLLFPLFALAAACSFASYGQVVVVIDPTKNSPEIKLSAADEKILKTVAIPRVKKKLPADACETNLEVAGFGHGSFSKPDSKQTLIFYQYCQTGNGLGLAGLVLIEDGKMIGNWVADSGWTQAVGALHDINANGLDEFTLSWGGGMHQGQGGVGVDVMEFSNGVPKGLGWFQVEQFDDTQATNVWKVTAKPGKVPIFYKQKYFSGEGEKWKRVGVNTPFKLKKVFAGNFEVVK